MKLLLDENISCRIVKHIEKDFPQSNHIDYLNMQGTSDSSIWEYAKENNFIIVSKDTDFRQRSFLFGSPPKVIWLSIGNQGTNVIKQLLLENIEVITEFENNPSEGLLVLESS